MKEKLHPHQLNMVIHLCFRTYFDDIGDGLK